MAKINVRAVKNIKKYSLEDMPERYNYNCDADKYDYYVRYKAADKEDWQTSGLMSKEQAEADVEFLIAYGYTAKICVEEKELIADGYAC